MSHHYDQDLRRTRERIGSVKTQLALNEAILEIPEVTVFDAKRIVAQLLKRKDSFKHIRKAKDARAAFVAWCVRQARLIARFRTLLPELHVDEQVASLALLRLPDYPGDEDGDSFETWVRETTIREAYELSSLAGLVTEHRSAVRRGIRKVLATCDGLGLDTAVGAVVDDDDDDGERRYSSLKPDGPWPLTVDELESDVWMEVARDIGKVLAAQNPAALLHEKGRWFARRWKTDRVREQKRMGDKKTRRYSVGLSGLEMTVTDSSGEQKTQDAVTCSFYDLHNSFEFGRPTEQRIPAWTDADLEHHLRRAGPFRADDVEIDDPLPAAA